MKRRYFAWAFTGITAVVTAVVILTVISPALLVIFGEYVLELVVYALLTGLAITLSIPLTRGELSVAHAIGMLAFLSLPARVHPAMTVAVCAGGFVGGLLLAARQRFDPHRQTRLPIYQTAILLAAQVTLPFYAAGVLYIATGAPLPLQDVSARQLLTITTPLSLYAVVYISLYALFFLIRLYNERIHPGTLLRESFTALLVILLLPVPFAVIAADVARSSQSMALFSGTVVAATLVIAGLYVLRRSEQRLREQLNEMRSLSVTTQMMRGALNLDSLLRATYVQISQLVPSDRFLVALHSEESGGELEYPLVISRGEEQTRRAQLPSDAALIDYVLAQRQPLLLADRVAERAQALGLPPPAGRFESWLGVPILRGGRPPDETASLGVFVLASEQPQRHFTENDLRLLNIIVASASIAFENANLYARQSARAEQLATLNQVSALLSGSLSPSEVLDTIISSASTISEASAVATYLYHDERRTQMALVRSAGLSEAFESQPPPPVLQKHESADSFFFKPVPLICEDIETDERAAGIREALRREGVRALIELPLTIGEISLGVIALYYRKPYPVEREQIDLLQAFITQAAQAINNARTYTMTDAELERRVEQLYVLASMGRLLNAAMDPDEIYRIVLTHVTDATKAPHGAVILTDAEGQIRVPAHKGYPDAVFRDSSTLKKGLIGRALQLGLTLRSDDTQLEPDYQPLVPGTHSLLTVPIMRGRRVLGMIIIESSEREAFSRSDSHFVAQIANQAVTAVDNTELFQRIREAHDNLRVILDAMEEGLILIDSDHRVALANPRVDLIGLSADAMIKQPVQRLLQDPELQFAHCLGFQEVDEVQQLLRDLDNPGATWRHAAHTFQIRDEEGFRYVQRQVIPVRSENGQVMGMLLVFYNKTEEYELERARSSFSSMVVHDLRSPLTAVTTSLRLLEEAVPRDAGHYPIVQETTEASRRAIRKVLTRVDSLLDIARMESGEMDLDQEPIELRHIVSNVRAELEPLARELDIAIVTQIAADLPLLNVDSDKVERMLLNLIDNALKYSPGGSTVTLRAQPEGTDFIRVAVADEGPGIPDEYKKRLFDQFVQLDHQQPMRRGVGLGLTFCRLVSEAHGGQIWIEDNEGGGSVFIATLPTIQMEEAIE